MSWLDGALSGHGASSNLSRSRPQISYGHIWCAKCDEACDFDITGGHRLWSEPDDEGETQGYLYIRADHHGKYVDIKMTFQQARHFLKSKDPRMIIFEEETALGLPEQKLVLPKLPLMLAERAVHRAPETQLSGTCPGIELQT